MGIVLIFFIFSLIMTACHGFGDAWVTKKEPGYFIQYSQLFWYYFCTCPSSASADDLKTAVSNNDGYGKAEYRIRGSNCGCVRYFTPRGSENACVGCITKYPNVGENKYFFFHTCYCKGCVTKDIKMALAHMRTLESEEEGAFNVKCEGHPDHYCICETYSARKGSEIAGCTRDRGWFPCPSTIEEYDAYYKSQINIYYNDNLQNSNPEMKPELSRRRR